jgi:hypothetical protein
VIDRWLRVPMHHGAVSDEDPFVAEQRFRDIREHVELLASPADVQLVWLNSGIAAPIDELAQSLYDIWPAWSIVVAPLLSPVAGQALTDLCAALSELDAIAYEDTPESLQLPEWDGIRLAARHALAMLDGQDSARRAAPSRRHPWVRSRTGRST